MSTRPGGLTALAVLNFVFAGLGIIAQSLLLVAVMAADAVASAAAAEADASVGAIYAYILLGFVTAGLLIGAGVGYLKQKRFGLVLGNAYAVLALLSTIIALTAAGQSFSIGTLIGMIYPVLTLILINTTFKENLQG